MIPNMSSVLIAWEIPVTLKRVTQSIVNHRPVETEVDVEIMAVVQPADMEKLNVDTIDYSLKYLQIHTRDIYTVVLNDNLIYDGLKYKAVPGVKDYSLYGYYETIFEQVK